MITITRSKRPNGWTVKLANPGGQPFSVEADTLEALFAAIRHYYGDRHAHWLCPLCQGHAVTDHHNVNLLAACEQFLAEWERGREWISEDTVDRMTRAVLQAKEQ